MPLHEGWRGGNGCMSCATEGQGNGPNIDDLSNFYNAYGNCDGCHDRGVQNIKRDMEGGSPTPQNFRGRQGKEAQMAPRISLCTTTNFEWSLLT